MLKRKNQIISINYHSKTPKKQKNISQSVILASEILSIRMFVFRLEQLLVLQVFQDREKQLLLPWYPPALKGKAVLTVNLLKRIAL